MTHLSGTALAIALLSLSVVMFFDRVTPEPPLTPEQTEMIVGACAMSVLSVRWLLRRWSRQEVKP